MLKRALSLLLVFLHLLTFGPAKDALAFSTSSPSYNLTTASTSQGGSSHGSTDGKLLQDTIGEPCVQVSPGSNYILSSGFISTLIASPPVLQQKIPYQKWQMNSAKENAFDLDEYFSSPDGYDLTYTVSNSANIRVNIAPDSHLVSFSQDTGWHGAEKITFSAQDSEYNITQSNEVALIVEGASGSNQPVIVEQQLSPEIIRAGDTVTLTVKALDADGDVLVFSFPELPSGISVLQNETTQEGDLWKLTLVLKLSVGLPPHFWLPITVTDSNGLSDTQRVLLNIGNLNHAPVLEPIPDLIVKEGDLAVFQPIAVDPDGDPLTFSFTGYFKASGSQGTWLTGYDDSGEYSIGVSVSDGIATAAQIAKVIVSNTNRPPQAILSLTPSPCNVLVNDPLTIALKVADPDKQDSRLYYSVKIDGVEFTSGELDNGKTFSTSTKFPEKGKHKITAEVFDRADPADPERLKALSIEEPVDVTDVNEQASPIIGDFDGNSLTDLGIYNYATGEWEVSLSRGTNEFPAASSWLSEFGASATQDFIPIGGDFNGDGKSDIGIYNWKNGEIKTKLSSGAKFSSDGPSIKFASASASWQPLSGNFDGDKYSDIAVYHKDSGEIQVALSDGSSFISFTPWQMPKLNGYTAMGGDFNGDSLTDILLFKKPEGDIKVYLANPKAKSFVEAGFSSISFAKDKDLLLADFNNDGLTDIGYWDKESGNWYYAISSGEKFLEKGFWLQNFGASNITSVTSGDFNGDSITDAALFDKTQIGINRWTPWITQDKQPADLLTQVNNGLEGLTVITYSYALKKDNPEVPFPLYVAKQIGLINQQPAERQASYYQEFNYSGGYFDFAEREFRGFKEVTATDPITKNYTQTRFHQGRDEDGALKGQIEQIIAYDANYRKISEVHNVYEVIKGGADSRNLGFPSLKEQLTTVYEENGSSLSTKDSFSYDEIGNLVTAVNEGDSNKAGDEKTASNLYAPAYSFYADSKNGFNRPLTATVKDASGKIISQKFFLEYDSSGNLKKDKVMIINPVTLQPNNAITQYSYDQFGNLASTTNALGRTITTKYEDKFHAFPLKVTNPLGHYISYTYEPKFGAIKSVTDANQNSSTTAYDTFGRVIEVKNALGQIVTEYSYSPDFMTKVTKQLNLSKTERIDSLGRKYQTISQGEDGNSPRNVISETFFNQRGLVEKESLSHYEGEDPNQISYACYEYDSRGRVVKTISDFPGTEQDAVSSVSFISPLYTEALDPKGHQQPSGHKKGVLKDVWGNIVEVSEFTTEGIFKTKYSYDTQNNLTKTIDNQGNITQIFYDSIGRKVKMIDPDMGEWSYEYDILGNLVKQIDAKGQALEFEYDTLNRLVKKSTVHSQQSTVLVNYIYDDSAKENCIGRLSKVIDQSGSSEFFYDELGREVKSVKSLQGGAASSSVSLRGASTASDEAISYTVLREYDQFDRLTKLTYPDGEVVNYTYDTNSGLLEKVFTTDYGLRTTDYVRDITYNAKGQIKNIQYGNNTATEYSYGQDLRLGRILTQSTVHSQQSTVLQDLNYSFDLNGNVTSMKDSLHRRTRNFEYDSLDRLTAESDASRSLVYSFQYDSIGNMLYKSDIGFMSYGQGLSPQGTVPDKPHAVTRAAGSTYRYDANGNLISVLGTKNKSLTYDSENRLTQLREGDTITSFSYDGDGGRVRKSTVHSQQSTETTYIGSLFEIDSSGKTTKHIFA
ncbi:MAG: toxin TcdB middle/N-terminal domain-containing protein, partial [Candidatus Omnitrophota bacterium]